MNTNVEAKKREGMENCSGAADPGSRRYRNLANSAAEGFDGKLRGGRKIVLPEI